MNTEVPKHNWNQTNPPSKSCLSFPHVRGMVSYDSYHLINRQGSKGIPGSFSATGNRDTPHHSVHHSATMALTSATAARAIFFSSVRSSASLYFSQLSSPSLVWMLSVS